MKKNKIIKDIVFIVMVLAFTSSFIVSRGIGDLDEIWNYNISNNFANGLVPYRDYNTLVTPLLQILAGIILKIFPNELLTMRILAVILISGILFLIYKILGLLKVNYAVKVFSIIGIMFLEKEYFCIDYNFFALFLTLIIMYLELKHLLNDNENKKDYKYNLLVGVIAGLVIMTKQTIGLLVSTATVGYMFIFILINKYKYKKEIKQDFKNLLFRILGITLPVFVFIVYLLCTNSLSYFIDYAILGVKTFSNKIEYKNLLQSEEIIIRLLAIFVPVSFIINFIIYAKYKNKNIFIINCLSIALFVVAFPISDNIHFLIGSTSAFIAIIYNLNKILKTIYKRINEKNDKLLFIKFFIEGVSECLVVSALLSGIYTNYTNIKDVEYYSSLKHYKYIPIPRYYEEELKKVEEYIQNSDKKVYILNFDAALYMIPIDRYNKDYDMFLKGNIGSKGEERTNRENKK